MAGGEWGERRETGGYSPLQRLAAVHAHVNSPLNRNQSCIELGPEAEARAAARLVDPSLDSSRRIWLYQTCAEFGYYQTCDPGTACPFTTSPHLDRLDVYLEQCRLAFNMTPGAIADNVAWSNVRSGGRSPGVDRVLWVQGDVDPWMPLGVTEGDDMIMVPDASHHFWTHVAKESDQPSVKRARELIRERIRGWLQPEGVVAAPAAVAAPSDGAAVAAGPWDSATAEDRASIGAWFDLWGSYVAEEWFELATSLFDTDAIGFGTWRDYVEGREALVDGQWRSVWPTISGFHHRTEDTLRVTVGADRLTAVGLVLWTSVGAGPDGSPFGRPGRTTAVFRRAAVGAPWLCIHTHVSLAKGVPQRSYGNRTAAAPSAVTAVNGTLDGGEREAGGVMVPGIAVLGVAFVSACAGWVARGKVAPQQRAGYSPALVADE